MPPAAESLGHPAGFGSSSPHGFRSGRPLQSSCRPGDWIITGLAAERGQDRARTSHLLTAGHESGQETCGMPPLGPESHLESAGRTGDVSSAAETLRLGPRGRRPHSGRRGLRNWACRSAFRHGAKGKREPAAPRRYQARSATRHGARLAPFLHQRTLRPLSHTHGKSYLELARGLARDYASAPDVVAYPYNEADVNALLDWAGGADATVTPFGGGSSVCGGVEPKRNGHKGAVTIATCDKWAR
jgi:hypothetical protein